LTQALKLLRSRPQDDGSRQAITLDTVVAMPFVVNRSNGESMDSADYGRFRLDLGCSDCIACAGLATGTQIPVPRPEQAIENIGALNRHRVWDCWKQTKAEIFGKLFHIDANWN
jgi:hypothetical protein